MHDPVAELHWYTWRARVLDSLWAELQAEGLSLYAVNVILRTRKRELEKSPLMVVMRLDRESLHLDRKS